MGQAVNFYGMPPGGQPINFYSRPPSVDVNTVLYLDFEGTEGSRNILDSSSYNHSVSLSTLGNMLASITTAQTIQNFSSLFVEGTSPFVSVKANDIFNIDTNNITIQEYIRFNSLTEGGLYGIFRRMAASDVFVDFYLNQSIDEFFVGINEFTLVFQNRDGGSPYTLTSNTFSLTLGEWHHVAMNYNFSTREINLYLDFVLIATGTNSINPPSLSGTDLLINHHGTSGGDWNPNGYIDLYTISNVVKTPGGQPINFYSLP